MICLVYCYCYSKCTNIEMLLSTDGQPTDTTATPDIGTVLKGKGSQPKNVKWDTAGVHSRSFSVPSGGSKDVAEAPKKGRGRARRSTNRDQSVEPTTTLDESQGVSSTKALDESQGVSSTKALDESQGVSSTKALDESQGVSSTKTVARSVLIDSAHSRTRRATARSRGEDNHSLSEHSSLELMSALGLQEKRPEQSDSQNVSHSETPNGCGVVSQAEFVETPLVKRRGRPRKTQHLSGTCPSDGLSVSPMIQMCNSNEKAILLDNVETDTTLGHPRNMDENNCLFNKKVELEPSAEVIASTPVASKSGQKRGRPRKSEIRDSSVESEPRVGGCSLDKEIDLVVDDIEPPKKKRGRPRKLTNDPLETQPERGSETSHEETPKTRRGRSRKITNDPVETGLETGSETSDEEPLMKKKIRAKGKIDSGKKSPKIKVEPKVGPVCLSWINTKCLSC